MISIVFTLSALVAFSNQQTVDQLLEGFTQVVGKHKPDCLAASGADSAVIDEELQNSKFEDDRATKCFWGCIYVKYSLITENNEVLEGNIRKFIGIADQDAADRIFQKCVHFKAADWCETATGISRCVYTNTRAFLERNS